MRAWDDGREKDAEEALLQIVRLLWGTEAPLLTTSEAARALGIRSINTLKVLLRAEDIETVKVGNRTMIPLRELPRLRSSTQLSSLRALAEMHERSAELGSDDGMSKEQLEALRSSRPGVAPWEQETPTQTE